MQLSLYENLLADIQCGQYDCLKNCCDLQMLTNIWRLMRQLGSDDLPRLQKMLCGCSVAASVPSGTGAVASDPKSNCTDTLTKWACANRSSLNTAKIGLAALGALQNNQMPLVVALTLFVNDLLSVCRPDGTPDPARQPIIDSIIDRICKFDVGVLSWLQTTGLPDVLISLIKGIAAFITPVQTLLASCCAVRPVSTANPWPTPPVSTTTPAQPPTVVVSAPPGSAGTATYTGTNLS